MRSPRRARRGVAIDLEEDVADLEALGLGGEALGLSETVRGSSPASRIPSFASDDGFVRVTRMIHSGAGS